MLIKSQISIIFFRVLAIAIATLIYVIFFWGTESFIEIVTPEEGEILEKDFTNVYGFVQEKGYRVRVNGIEATMKDRHFVVFQVPKET